MHPLTIMAVGLYGETLLNQNGAPLRLVVPWKYGFKSIKSIVAHPPDREAAADDLKNANAARVRLLFQRQSGSRSSALEPGDRAAHRRERPVREAASDPAVQRLWCAGGAALARAWTSKPTTSDDRRHSPVVSSSALSEYLDLNAGEAMIPVSRMTPKFARDAGGRLGELRNRDN